MISSRTPEGDPNRCPVCGKEARVEPSTVPTRDAPCPHCGCLLWFPKLVGPSVDAIRVRVNRLAEEIAELSKAKLAPAEYYEEFLHGLMSAIAAPAGAVWVRTANEILKIQYQINMRQVGLNEYTRPTHDELLRQVTAKVQPGIIMPHSSIGQLEESKVSPGNPTDYVILFAPIMCDQQLAGLIEIWQDPKRGPDAQRGYLQFMVRMAGLASGYARMAAAG